MQLTNRNIIANRNIIYHLQIIQNMLKRKYMPKIIQKHGKLCQNMSSRHNKNAKIYAAKYKEIIETTIIHVAKLTFFNLQIAIFYVRNYFSP